MNHISRITGILLIISLSTCVYSDNDVSVAESTILQMYDIYLQGSGLDDGVANEILNNPSKYATPLTKLLHASKPNSKEQKAALGFIEYVKEEKGVHESLCAFGKQHVDKEIRHLVMLILGDSSFSTPVQSNEKDGYVATLSIIRPMSEIKNNCEDFSCCPE